MSALILAVLGCAGGRAPGDAYQAALRAEDPREALALCDDAGDMREECVATVVRASPELGVTPCRTLPTPRWRGECHFAVAEARAKAQDRWGALLACGEAGDFYNECLYHAWTFELQLAVDGLGRAVDGLEKARPIVAFWSGIQTIGPDAESQIWRDWWYFAHARNKPASLDACATLPDEADRRRCEDGTRMFVRRSVVEALIRKDDALRDRDRVCRGEPSEVQTVLGQLYLPDPRLDEEVVAALASGCGSAPPERPWNPVFRPRRLGR